MGIGPSAFENTEFLEELYLPNSVTFLAERAFHRNSRLRVLHLSDQIEMIPSSTLYTDSYGTLSNNRMLTDVRLPRRLKHVGTDAFYDTALKDVTLPEGVITLGRYAFASLHLKKAFLPKSLVLCESGSLYGAKEITAYEGTARGLVSAVNPYTEKDENRYRFVWHSCRVRVLSPENGSLVGFFLIPESLKTTCASLLGQAWDAPQIDYVAYEQIYANIKTAAEKLEIALILYFQGGKAGTYLDYIKKNALKAGTFLIETGQLERFTDFLDLNLLSKSSAKKLLELCNEKQYTEYIAYLMDYQEKNTSKRSTSRFSL